MQMSSRRSGGVILRWQQKIVEKEDEMDIELIEKVED